LFAPFFSYILTDGKFTMGSYKFDLLSKMVKGSRWQVFFSSNISSILPRHELSSEVKARQLVFFFLNLTDENFTMASYEFDVLSNMKNSRWQVFF
jgi:hypothetical protein